MKELYLNEKDFATRVKECVPPADTGKDRAV